MIGHDKFMQRALELARKGAGLVSPNPMVGCVIVQNGKILAEGFHKKFGGPHAEVNALNKIKNKKLKTATLYVTLEPCHHFGKTPPCVDAVIASGIKHVVMAMKDPNPLTSGKSIKKLKRAGLKVTLGICELEARELNKAFIKHIKTGLPYVTAKVALSADGALSKSKNIRVLLSGPKSFDRTQKLRSQNMAILVGKNTILVDDPMLNVRSLKKPQPVRVILDSSLSVSPKSKIFTSTGGQVLIFHVPELSQSKVLKFNKIAECVPVKMGSLQTVSIQHVFKILGSRGIHSILIEGGERILSSVTKDKLVDEWNFVLTPKILGKDSLKIFSSLQSKPKFKILNVENVGDDIWVRAAFNKS